PDLTRALDSQAGRLANPAWRWGNPIGADGPAGYLHPGCAATAGAFCGQPGCGGKPHGADVGRRIDAARRAAQAAGNPTGQAARAEAPAPQRGTGKSTKTVAMADGGCVGGVARGNLAGGLAHSPARRSNG